MLHDSVCYVPGIRVLYNSSVVYGPDTEIVGIANCALGDQDGAYWCGRIQSLRKRPLAAFELLCASTNVISTRVSENVVKCVLLCDVFARLRYYQGELRFIVAGSILYEPWNPDFLRPRTHQSMRRLEEQHRYIWYRHIGLFSMIAVVEPEATNDALLVSRNRRQELCWMSITAIALQS